MGRKRLSHAIEIMQLCGEDYSAGSLQMENKKIIGGLVFNYVI